MIIDHVTIDGVFYKRHIVFDMQMLEIFLLNSFFLPEENKFFVIC